MTTKQAISILKKYNKWRRGDCDTKMQSPAQIGLAIDVVVEQLELRDIMVKKAYSEGFKNRPM